jgi:hypothetical protein
VELSVTGYEINFGTRQSSIDLFRIQESELFEHKIEVYHSRSSELKIKSP